MLAGWIKAREVIVGRVEGIFPSSLPMKSRACIISVCPQAHLKVFRSFFPLYYLKNILSFIQCFYPQISFLASRP